MRKISLIALLVMSIVGGVFAQGARQTRSERTPEERAEMLTARMVKKLSLNDAQAEKLNAVHLTHAQKMDELRTKYNADQRAELRTEMKAVMDETERQYKAILTPEQLETYQQMKDERKEKMKHRRGNRGR